MSALLATMVVEVCWLDCVITVGVIFSELAATMDKGLHGVKLTQLLSHTSGIPSDNADFDRLIEQSEDCVGAALSAVRRPAIGGPAGTCAMPVSCDLTDTGTGRRWHSSARRAMPMRTPA